MSSPSIAILGAGPSGLLLGRMLELNNIPYVIYERDETSNLDQGSRSGTLDIHTNTGQLALQEAGLLDQFKTLARYDVSTVIADANNKVLISFDHDDTGDEQSRPEIDRRDLRRLLLSSIPEQRIQWGKRVKQVQRSDEGRLSVQFADGSIESEIDLIVGADGAWSKARNMMTSTKPQYSGITFFTTNIASDDAVNTIAANLAGRGSYISLQSGRQISTQMLADGSYYTVFGVKGLSETWQHDNADLVGDEVTLRKHLLQHHFSDFDPTCKALIEKGRGRFYVWPLYSMPTAYLEEESIGDVVLMGDAAHVTPPSGEGVNWALYDALQLSKQLVQTRASSGEFDLIAAIRAYEAEAKPRWNRTVNDATTMITQMYADDSPQSFLRGFLPEEQTRS